MTADHRAEAEANKAAFLEMQRHLKAAFSPIGHAWNAAVEALDLAEPAAALADRCPDPAAHRPESVADQLDALWSQVRSDRYLLEDAVPHVRALVDVTELGAKDLMVSEERPSARYRSVFSETARLRAELAAHQAGGEGEEFELHPPVGWLNRVDEVLRWHGATDHDGSHLGEALGRLIRSWQGPRDEGPGAYGPQHWGERAPEAAHQAEDTGVVSTPLGRLLDKVGVENPEDAATATVIANLKTDNEDARDLLAKRAATIIELRRALGEANELLAEARVALDHEEFAPAGYIPAQAHLLVQEEVTRLRTELAEARAARPAPMPPEVVAVVEAARFLEREVNANGDRGGRGWDRVLATVRALPEGWRDGAAPAAVPDDSILRDTLELIDAHGCQAFTGTGRCLDEQFSGLTRISTTGTADQWCDPCRARDALNRAAAVPAELDPAGVERVARVMAGIDATAPCRPLTEWQLWRDRARVAVRAYLGDTDTGSEAS